MNEEGWLACADPRAMLLFLASVASDRKARLCAVACCRRDPIYRSDANMRRIVMMAEAFADGLVDEAALHSVTCYDSDEDPALEAARSPTPGVPFVTRAAHAADLVCSWHADPTGNERGTPDFLKRVVAVKAELSRLVRDIFGNPFHPTFFSPQWRTDTAVALAHQMYESRDFGAMPILADALQDAGCEDADILDHCRDAGQLHVRGCWVVDLVIGRE
jgi:hypothetical protein